MMQHDVAYLDPVTHEIVKLRAVSKIHAEETAFILTGQRGLTFTHARIYRDAMGDLASQTCVCGSDVPDALPEYVP